MTPARTLRSRVATALALGFIFAPIGAKVATGAVSGVNARAPIPVHFAGGTVSAKFTGKVTRNRADTYVLAAEAGQTMSIEVEAPDGSLSPIDVGVAGAKTRVDPDGYGQSWNGKIPTTGPFEIVVRGSDPGDLVRYTLTITISGFASDPALPRGIEQVDFGDVTVSFGGTSHRLRYGHLAAPDPEDSSLMASIEPPQFGLVDGYAGELAAILIYSRDPDGTGLFSELNLFALRDGKPALVADLPGGDRADGGIHTAKIAGGRLVVEVYAPPPSGGICCPGFVDTVRYRLSGGKLVRDGKPARRIAIEDKDY
jgi:hypothetical protein